jgi:hypothetical protein
VLALARAFAEREGGALALRRARRGTEVRVALIAAPMAKPASSGAGESGTTPPRAQAATPKPAAPAGLRKSVKAR